ncbi:MAG: hypothetical protein ABIF82_00140 [Planctomycetota bacterium]
MKKLTRSVVMAAAMGILVGLSGAAYGGVVTLADGSSTVKIETESSLGVFGWSIGELSVLEHQWFWFRTNLPEWNAREYSIDELGTPNVLQIPVMPNLAILTYTEERADPADPPRFSVQVTYMLTSGAGLLSADLMENVKVTNLSNSTLTFDIFQYSDFDLSGDDLDHSIAITGGNRVLQTGYGPALITLSETVTTGSPDLSEVAVFSTTFDKLTNGGIDDLDGSKVGHGPADLTWAFQWSERSIAPGQAFMISKDKLLTVEPIPEPAGLGLIGLALLAVRRKRS